MHGSNCGANMSSEVVCEAIMYLETAVKEDTFSYSLFPYTSMHKVEQKGPALMYSRYVEGPLVGRRG